MSDWEKIADAYPDVMHEATMMRDALEELLAAAIGTGRTGKPRASLNAGWVARICSRALAPEMEGRQP